MRKLVVLIVAWRLMRALTALAFLIAIVAAGLLLVHHAPTLHAPAAPSSGLQHGPALSKHEIEQILQRSLSS